MGPYPNNLSLTREAKNPHDVYCHHLFFYYTTVPTCPCNLNLKGEAKYIFFFNRKPRVNILIEKEVQKEDEESSHQK